MNMKMTGKTIWVLALVVLVSLSVAGYLAWSLGSTSRGDLPTLMYFRADL